MNILPESFATFTRFFPVTLITDFFKIFSIGVVILGNLESIPRLIEKAVVNRFYSLL